MLLSARPAQAGNEDEIPVGNLAAIKAGAVVADVGDGSAVYYNPAGLARVERNRVDVTASAYGLRVLNVPGFLRTEDGTRKDASVVEFVAIPSEIAYVRRLADGVTLGLGYYVPAASDAILRERLTAEHDGVTSTYALDLRVTSTYYVLGAALGVELTPRLRVGGGLFGVFDQSVESASVFAAISDGAATTRAVQLSVLGTRWALSGAPGVGVQWDATDALTVGAAARGPRIQLARSGDDSLNAVQATPGDAATPQVLTLSSEQEATDTHLGVLDLGRYNLGFAYRRGPLSVSAEADIQPGFESARTGASRALTFNARIGATYRLSDALMLGGGLFSDRDPSAAITGSASSRVDYYGGALGMQIDMDLDLAEEGETDDLVLSTIFALRYAYGSGTSNVLVVSAEPEFENLLGTASGRAVHHEVGLHVGSGLFF